MGYKDVLNLKEDERYLKGTGMEEFFWLGVATETDFKKAIRGARGKQ